ncbi:MAG: sugar kinase [Burkholderiaceae bacterium]
MAKKTFDVCALGEAMVEFNQTIRGEPGYLQGFGGDTSNAAIAAARAGARAAYVTRVGADTFGDALMQLWTQEGVDISGVTSDATSPTGIYFVTHGANGHAFSYRRSDSAASRMTPQWLEGAAAELICQSQFLHLSGISLAISTQACDTAFEAMALARGAGTRVSFDSNLRLKLWPLARAKACTVQALSMCDIFLPGLDDMLPLTGLSDPDAIVDWSHAHGAATVVLKLGGAGVLVSDGGQRASIAAHPVALRDATAAGDCFCGNLLARLAQGDELFLAARYANAAAALSVQGFGAVTPLPRPEAVRALLQSLKPGLR